MQTSVVVPCHNAEEYLAQAIGSLLQQTEPPAEVIIVDDASTDGSLSIARQLAGRFRNVTTVAKSFRNASSTRNFGAMLARSECLMFFDADDVLAPNTLQALSNALVTRSSGVAACPWQRLNYVNGRFIGGRPSCSLRKEGQPALSAWLSGWYYPPSSVLWTRRGFELTGGWDENATINDDGDLMMRALLYGAPFIEVPRGLAFYRRLPREAASLSGKRRTQSGLRAQLYVFEKLGALMEEHNRLDKYRCELAEAVDRVAEDAVAYPDLYRSAYSLARELQPSSGARLVAKARKKFVGATYAGFPVESTFPMVGERVRFGEDLDHEVLRENAAQPRFAPLSPSQAPRVSVVIPTHDRATVLPRALNSVLSQTYSDLEVLVVDDHSADETGLVVGAYTDQRVRYLEQDQNLNGVAAARNLGLRKAVGEFVAFLDDDDEWLPEKLAKQIPLFDSDARVGLVYAGAVNIYSEERSAVRVAEHRGYIYREMLVRNRIHGLSGVVIRRNLVREVGFFDETLPAIEDYDYWVRICRRHYVDRVSEPLLRYYDPRDEKPGCFESQERRSRNIRDNIIAREMFFRKHRGKMKEFGVARAFLFYTLKWYLNQSDRAGRWVARRLAVRSFLSAPLDSEVRHILRRCFDV